ncbi:MAG: hypothetical protein FWE76_06715 [Symbiobacteriaceae bacterium]|nr:hypothetical protein [Symbiobacteriaceae bacterium]
MNIIRTSAVELSTIPAIAYKQKLSAGGAGIKILRLDLEASAVGSIDKRTGEIVAYGKIDAKLFPPEAFDEALELVAGLPYSARGKIALKAYAEVEVEDVPDEDDGEAAEDESAAEEISEEPDKLDMTHSAEYIAIVERYSDENGKLNYTLMNKDFIQFASRSKVVTTMVAERAKTDDIVLFVIKSRAALIAGKRESLDDVYAAALIATLDEINPRSAFKELKAHLNRLLARKK